MTDNDSRQGTAADADDGRSTHSHFYRWSEVKAELGGGPPPTCSACGEPAVAVTVAVNSDSDEVDRA